MVEIKKEYVIGVVATLLIAILGIFLGMSGGEPINPNLQLPGAPGTGNLTGEVRSGNVFDFFVVKDAFIEATNGTVTYNTTSDLDGIWIIQGVEPSTYNVTASKTGYSTQTQTGILVIADTETTVPDFYLTFSYDEMNQYIWNGTNWVSHNSTNRLKMRCNIPSNNCEPQEQNTIAYFEQETADADNYTTNYFYTNWTKPTEYTASLTDTKWEVMHGGSTASCPTQRYNITLPSNCVNQSPLQTRFYSTNVWASYSESTPQCYNGTGWENIGNNISAATAIGQGGVTSNPSYADDDSWVSWAQYQDSGSFGTGWNQGISLTTRGCSAIVDMKVWWARDIGAALLAENFFNKDLSWISMKSSKTFDSSYQFKCSTSNLSAAGVPINTSYVNLTSDLTEVCYQETANISTSCGGLATGTYDLTTNFYFKINYEKPTNAVSGNWLIKHGDYSVVPDAYNISIPSACFNLNPIQLRVFSRFADSGGTKTYGSQPQCYDGSSWIDIGEDKTALGSTGCSHNAVYDSTVLYDGDWNTRAAFRGWSTNLWTTAPSGTQYSYCKPAFVWEEAMYWNIANYTINIPKQTNQSIYCWLTLTEPLTSPGRWNMTIIGGQ